MNPIAWRKARGTVLPILALIGLEAGFHAFDVRSDSLAAPSAVLRSLVEGVADGALLRATAMTLWCALAGVALASFVGILLGAVLGLSRILSELAHVPVESLRHLPPVALMPIVILVLGLGVPMEVSIVAFTCFWPVMLLTRAAVAGVEPRLLEVARVLQLGARRTLVQIVLPAAAPRIMVAVRLAVGIALIVAITTEIAANPLGLGYLMVKAQQELQPARLFAGLVWLALLGWTTNALMLRLERAATPGPRRAAP